MSFPDHPVIANCMRTGYPDGKDPKHPICKVCGAECETIYKDREGTAFACDVCVNIMDAWDVSECFQETEPHDDYYDGDEPC